MSNETVTYSLEAVLTRIESKIDSLEKRMDERFDKVEDRLTKVEIGQAELKAEVRIQVIEKAVKPILGKHLGSSRLCVIIFAYEIVKWLLGKTFRTILLNKLSV